MIRVLMFDLGQTLIDPNHHPFPHVPEALTAISGFTTAAGKPPLSCLVSDFTTATPPVTPAKATALFHEYRAILEERGLRSFFEPVKKRVILSTHAKVKKPDQKIFEKALQRLGISGTLEECLFITENADHIAEARNELHMQVLQFQAPPESQYGFDDWAEAPALIANLVAPHQFANTHAAIQAHLSAQGIELLTAEPAETPDTIRVSGQVWRPVSVPGFDDLHNLRVAIPVEGLIARGPKGELQSAALGKPSAEQIAEVTSYVRSLATQGQIEGRPGKHPFRPTHQIETDEQGNRRLVRKRFTAR